MPELNHKKFLTPEEVATGYGFSSGHLANLRCKKIGPKYFKVGARKVLYDVIDVERWIRSQPVLTKDSIDI